MKYLYSFLIGFLIVMALDVAWGLRAEAQKTVYLVCQRQDGFVAVYPNQCPIGWKFLAVQND